MIGLECKDAVVAKVKECLKDPSSYEEIDWSMFVNEDITEIGEGGVSINLTYSATNSFGGRLQESCRAIVNGTYDNNTFSIEKILF